MLWLFAKFIFVKLKMDLDPFLFLFSHVSSLGRRERKREKKANTLYVGSIQICFYFFLPPNMRGNMRQEKEKN